MQLPSLQCKDCYQAQFAEYARHLASGVTLDECLHDFLDRPIRGRLEVRGSIALRRNFRGGCHCAHIFNISLHMTNRLVSRRV
ncbi:hypothetical protein IPC1622_29115 [Pseudomonas aeruginosa]|nr:hypothetical protein DY966_02485 [Pseudomonas aeruginosa]RUA40377.1 hypothetical protein IPC1622_29115 [Pseudomonas aeruginosa]